MIREGIYVGEAAGELVVTMPRVDGKLDENGRIESVLIDARKFYIVVERHVGKYVKSLRDASNAELRESFKKAVDVRWPPDDTTGRFIGMSEHDFLNRPIQKKKRRWLWAAWFLGLRWWVDSADDLNLSAWAKADATQVNSGRAFRSILGCNASGFAIVLAIENRGLEVVTV